MNTSIKNLPEQELPRERLLQQGLKAFLTLNYSRSFFAQVHVNIQQ